MQYFFTTVALAFAALVPDVSAGFSPDASSNIAVYWGQNSVNKIESEGGQKRLSYYCQNSKIDVIPLSFLTNIITPALNFANQGTANLEADIQECQDVYHKTILLSIGGETYNEGGFKDGPDSAVAAAKQIWAMFGPPTGSSVQRPFGSAVINGFDFDNEARMVNGVQFARELRRLMTESSTKTGKKYLLTAAPQCVFPDVNVGDMLNEVEFDAAFIQYYNNDCGVKNFDDKSRFNFDIWDHWAKHGSKNSNIKLLIGAPGNVGGASSGYVSGDVLVRVIKYAKNFPSFGGIMLWEMTQTYSNLGLLNQVYGALGASSNPTTSISRSPSSTSTKARTTSKTTVAALVKPTYPPAPAPTTLSTRRKVVEASRTTKAGSKTTVVGIVKAVYPVEPSTPKPVKPVKTQETVKAESVKATNVQSGAGTVNQWNQCAGKDWNGGRKCKSPYICTYFSEWYSQCQ